MDLREIGWSGMNWADLAQVRDQCGALVESIIMKGGVCVCAD
jgi:hypothetical protein